MSAPAALSLRAVTKRFGATLALDAASCEVRTGTVHALLGENGAGKTTLMRAAFGLVTPDAGDVERDGRPLPPGSSRAAIAAGLGMVHQHFMLVPAFTVAENAALGGRGGFDAREAAERVRAVSAATGLAVDPHARVRDLPVSAQQRAELLRALARDARVMILDEPTAVLTPEESDELYRWMRRFADSGGTVVLITHKLREALAVADDVTVLRRGRTVLAAARQGISEAMLVEALVGAPAAPDDAAPVSASPSGDVIFALEQVSVRDARGVAALRDVSLTVRRGEILGVLGVEGAGQAELLRVLAGRLAATSGRVRRPARVGFIPADRLHDAVIPAMTVTENLVLADAALLRGTIPWATRTQETRAVIEDFDVRAGGPNVPLATLSGGNQQKFVVGRERRVAPDALVAENPTRGLDVRATARVHDELRRVALSGAGAVVVSSTDLDEVLALTRRIVVCFGGTVTEIPPPADPNDRAPYARALVGAGT